MDAQLVRRRPNVHFTQKGHLFTYNVASKKLLRSLAWLKARKRHLSPALNAAYTVDNNVYVNWSEDGSMQQVTFHEDANIVAGRQSPAVNLALQKGCFGTRVAMLLRSTRKMNRLYQTTRS